MQGTEMVELPLMQEDWVVICQALYQAIGTVGGHAPQAERGLNLKRSEAEQDRGLQAQAS